MAGTTADRATEHARARAAETSTQRGSNMPAKMNYGPAYKGGSQGNGKGSKKIAGK